MPTSLPRRGFRLAVLALAGCLMLAGCDQHQADVTSTPGDRQPGNLGHGHGHTGILPHDGGGSRHRPRPARFWPRPPDAGRSYVEETLFIGDSNTARYMMYADETGEAFTSLSNNIGVVSMGVGAITTLKCEQFVGYSQMYTIPDAVPCSSPGASSSDSAPTTCPGNPPTPTASSRPT